METRQEMEFLKIFEKDSCWLLQNYEKVQKEFEEKFVAVKNGKVIADGKNIQELTEKLKKREIDPRITVIDFIPRKDFLLFL